MPEYAPAVRPGMMSVPPVPDVSDTGPTELLFFRYVTLYAVLAARPVRVMKPSAAPQIVGLVPVAVAICGVGLTVTAMLLASEVQPSTVTVAL
jgi:hypothetical protein